ncbi:MAG: hypothetical protein ACOYXM_06085 [Actinomycetota bacterium]
MASRGAIVKGTFWGICFVALFAIPALLVGAWAFWMVVAIGIAAGTAMGIVVKLDWQPSPRVNRWTEAFMRLRPPGAAHPPYLPGGSTYLPEESLSVDPQPPYSDPN